MLRHLLDEREVPIAWPTVDERSVRGWYGTPMTITTPVPDPTALHAKLTAAGVPVRSLYEDWTQTPLLQQPDLAARYWPHVTHSPYRPPTRDTLPNYGKAMRQMLVLKVPQIIAPDYMEQVAKAFTAGLDRAGLTA